MMPIDAMHLRGPPPPLGCPLPLFPNPTRPNFMFNHRRSQIDGSDEKDWNESTSAFLQKLRAPRQIISATEVRGEQVGHWPIKQQAGRFEQPTQSSNHPGGVQDEFMISDDSLSSDEAADATRDVRVIVRRQPPVDDGSVIIRRTIRNDLQQDSTGFLEGAGDNPKMTEVIQRLPSRDVPKPAAKKRRIDPEAPPCPMPVCLVLRVTKPIDALDSVGDIRNPLCLNTFC